MSVGLTYITNDKGWETVQDSQVTRENKSKIVLQTTKMAFSELAKVGQKAALLILTGVISVVVFLIILKIAPIVIGAVLFPLALIPSIYVAITGVDGLVVMATTSAAIISSLLSKSYAKRVFTQMQEHFNHSQHLFSEAMRVRNLEVL